MEQNLSLYERLSKADDSNKAGIFYHYLSQQANKLKKPNSIQLELLPLCNFNCSFCYVRKTNDELEKSGQHILRLNDWKYYIDESKKLGVNAVTLSGGECTIHPDFKEIYEYAYKQQMRLSIITNGSCITDQIFQLFEKYPPEKIAITMYGMSRKTYERTCGNGAAFEKVLFNIDRLKHRGFNVLINYTAGKDNFCDMEEVLNYARKNHLSAFPMDALMASENCSNIVENGIVDHKEYRKILNKHYSALYNIPLEDYENYIFNSYFIQTEHHKKGLPCSATKSMISINWLGMMIPCVTFNMIQFDPRLLGFENCWEQIKTWGSEVPILQECEDCIFQTKCALCPALHYIDTGEFGKVSSRFCFKKIYPEEAAKIQALYESQKSKTTDGKE